MSIQIQQVQKRIRDRQPPIRVLPFPRTAADKLRLRLQQQARRRASGMGSVQSSEFNIDDFLRTYGEAPPPVVYNPELPEARQTANPSWVDTWLGPVLLTGLQTTSNIFAPPQTSVARAQADAIAAASRQRLYEGTDSSGVGISFTSRGLRLSDGSYVGWLTIAAVVGGFMLLQARPLSRK